MFSSVSTLFDKNFFIGFLLPAIIGLIALAWLYPGVPLLQPFANMSAGDEQTGKLIYVILLSYGAAVALLITNTLQYRVLEGYWPPTSWLGFLRRASEAKRVRVFADYNRLFARWEVEQAAFPPADFVEMTRLRRELVTEFLPKGQEMMPMRFGNVKRAFEWYAYEAYGVDGPAVMPRLVYVVAKDDRQQLDDARAQVDCLVNLVFILSIVAVLAVVQTISAIDWRLVAKSLQVRAVVGWRLVLPLPIGIAAAVALPFVYRLAILRAAAWGDVVKATFDCYLPTLTRQLGFLLPGADAQRRAFWFDLNALMIYRQPLPTDRWRHADSDDRQPRFVERRRAQAAGRNPQSKT